MDKDIIEEMTFGEALNLIIFVFLNIEKAAEFY